MRASRFPETESGTGTVIQELTMPVCRKTNAFPPEMSEKQTRIVQTIPRPCADKEQEKGREATEDDTCSGLRGGDPGSLGGRDGRRQEAEEEEAQPVSFVESASLFLRFGLLRV